MTVLSTAYFPPIEYFALMAKSSSIIIDVFEHYQRQTYRNRCHISTDKGIQMLSVPVIKTSGHYTILKEISIDYHENWQRVHWRAIEAAYNNSPFFLYYRNDLKHLFENHYPYLLDFNLACMDFCLKKLKLSVDYKISTGYIEKTPDMEDLRDLIHPKKESLISNFPTYMQVFSDKQPFIPNLSILDLLCNLGNESISYLKSLS